MLDMVPIRYRIAVYLGCIEIGLGGVFHSLRFPCTGYVLSLHQIFCLNRAVRDMHSLFSPIKISLAAGFLKVSLPSTKTLTPFVAIVMQGVLFNVGTLLCGRTIVGRCVGSIFSCLWGFVQPFLIVSLVLGKSMMEGFAAVNVLTQQWHINLFGVIFFIVLFKVILAAGLCFYSDRMSRAQWDTAQGRLFSLIRSAPFVHSNDRSRITSFFNVWFVIPIVFSIIGLITTKKTLIDGFLSFSQGVVLYMFIFVGINLIPTSKVIRYLTQKNYQWLAEPCMHGLNLLKGMEKKK